MVIKRVIIHWNWSKATIYKAFYYEEIVYSFFFSSFSFLVRLFRIEAEIQSANTLNKYINRSG